MEWAWGWRTSNTQQQKIAENNETHTPLTAVGAKKLESATDIQKTRPQQKHQPVLV